jgi:hypothetical protein
MKKLYLCASALALCVGAAAMRPSGRLYTSSSLGGNGAEKNRVGSETSRLTSGAYRDGLYLGRLTAQRGRPHHVASGRWATADDRALFTAGYDQGYQESAAGHATAANGELDLGDCVSAIQRRISCEPILN